MLQKLNYTALFIAELLTKCNNLIIFTANISQLQYSNISAMSFIIPAQSMCEVEFFIFGGRGGGGGGG